MRVGYTLISKEPKTFPDYGPDKCLFCGKSLPPRKRKYCCESHGNKYRFAIAEQELITWAEFRERILKRDDYICYDCNGKAEVVHHKIPIYQDGIEFEPGNCISLCEICHKIKHKKRGSLIELGKHKQLKLDC